MRKFENEIEDGNHICRTCNGRKVIPEIMNELKCVCNHCQGQGTVDWVSHAMKRRPPLRDGEEIRQLHYNVAMRNIDYLMKEIRRQAYAINIDVEVSIEKRPKENLMSHIIMPSYNPKIGD